MTESEPEPEPEEPGAKDADSGSETEPDEEGEAEAEKSLQPRPEFVVPPDRKGIRPLVLEPGYVVPWKINTFLRDYQRAGVRFFIERYKEGRGALLGDDMGLVRPLSSSRFLPLTRALIGCVTDGKHGGL